MKKSILLLIGFVATGMFVHTSRAQYGSQSSSGQQKGNQAEATLLHRPEAQTESGDARAKYDAALKQKKDGDFLLYTDKEGTRLYLPVKKGRVGAYHATSSKGQDGTVRLSNESGKCYACWGPDSNQCEHKVQVPCAKK